jgi:hypothetical protein
VNAVSKQDVFVPNPERLTASPDLPPPTTIPLPEVKKQEVEEVPLKENK